MMTAPALKFLVASSFLIAINSLMRQYIRKRIDLTVLLYLANNNNNNNNDRFTALCPGLPGWASTRRNTHPPTIQSLSASSIYHDPLHPPCSNYVLGNLFAQPLSMSTIQPTISDKNDMTCAAINIEHPMKFDINDCIYYAVTCLLVKLVQRRLKFLRIFPDCHQWRVRSLCLQTTDSNPFNNLACNIDKQIFKNAHWRNFYLPYFLLHHHRHSERVRVGSFLMTHQHNTITPFRFS